MPIGTSTAYQRALQADPDLDLTEEEFYQRMAQIMMGELPTEAANRGLDVDADGKVGSTLGQNKRTTLTST